MSVQPTQSIDIVRHFFRSTTASRLQFARDLTGKQRTTKTNQHLGFTLAFVAGAINAGGYLAVNQYTSHMTGIVSAMADNLALRLYLPVLAAFGALLSFLIGSASCAIMVNYARRRDMHSEYAFPVLLEAALLLCFGMLGATLAKISGLFVPVTVMLLCFIMGLQNAVITKISNAEIRTTHVTGIVTDIGIELGKLVYWNSNRHEGHGNVMANREHLRVLSLLLMFFFVGGIMGALGFKHFGYRMTIPLALILVGLAILPMVDDFIVLMRRLKS